MCVSVCAALTLNDVGDHESSAGVVTDETTAGEVAFYLQGKQIPGERNREIERQRYTEESVRGRKGGKKGEVIRLICAL